MSYYSLIKILACATPGFVSKDAFTECRERLALNVLGIRKDCRHVVTALQNVSCNDLIGFDFVC